LRRIKTLKHPSILQFKGGLERDDTTVVTTESAIPLHTWIQKEYNESQVVLGFSQILDALQFLNEDCGLVHGNVTPNSIIVNASGDWKLGGLDLLSEYECAGAVPNLWITNPRFVPEKYQDPERRSGRWKGGSTRFSSDVYSFAMTMKDLLGNRIPSSIEACIQKMLSDSTRRRPSPKRVLKLAKVFKSDPFVATMRELKNWALMESERRAEFFKMLTPLVENFPKSACIHKLLPILLESIRFAENDTDASGASCALAPLLTVGSMIEDPQEFQKNILPPVIRLFASNNRAVRLQLLRHANVVVPKLPQSTMNTKIFDNMRGGFADTVPALREWTIRSMIHVVPLLNDANKEKLLESFRKLIRDPLPPIRNNVVVCLTRVSKLLPEKTRVRSLLQLYAAATRDPVADVRRASLSGISQIIELIPVEVCIYFCFQLVYLLTYIIQYTCTHMHTHTHTHDAQIRAKSVLPMVAPMLVDPGDEVRKMAQNVMDKYMKELRKYTPPKPVVSTANIGTMKTTRPAMPQQQQQRYQRESPRRTVTEEKKIRTNSRSRSRSSSNNTTTKKKANFFEEWGEDDDDDDDDVTEVKSIGNDRERRRAERKERAAKKREELRRKREERKQQKKVVVVSETKTKPQKEKNAWGDDAWGFDDDDDDDIPVKTPKKKRERKKSVNSTTKKLGAMKLSSKKKGLKGEVKKKKKDFFEEFGGDDDDAGGGAWDF